MDQQQTVYYVSTCIPQQEPSDALTATTTPEIKNNEVMKEEVGEGAEEYDILATKVLKAQ